MMYLDDLVNNEYFEVEKVKTLGKVVLDKIQERCEILREIKVGMVLEIRFWNSKSSRN